MARNYGDGLSDGDDIDTIRKETGDPNCVSCQFPDE